MVSPRDYNQYDIEAKIAKLREKNYDMRTSPVGHWGKHLFSKNDHCRKESGNLKHVTASTSYNFPEFFLPYRSINRPWENASTIFRKVG